MYTTDYGRAREELKEKLKAAREFAREYILNQNTSGYYEMDPGYDLKVYTAICEAIDAV